MTRIEAESAHLDREIAGLSQLLATESPDQCAVRLGFEALEAIVMHTPHAPTRARAVEVLLGYADAPATRRYATEALVRAEA